MTALTLQGIQCKYGDTLALDTLDLVIDSGELFSLLGPSGCGKTSLLRIIAGFLGPSAGRLYFDGEDMTRVPAHARNIGMVFQDYALFPDRSVFDNVAFGLRTRNIDRRQISHRVGTMLERLGLSAMAQRRPAALSGGQRQRVAMARALVISPRILLLDEPLSALDAKLRLELRQIIREVQREFGITTLFVTHDQDEALSISDRVALLAGGRIEQLGTPLEMYDWPASAFVADFLGGANLLPVSHIEISSDGRIHYQLAGQSFVTPQTHDTTPSPDWRLCVRPHEWILRPAMAAMETESLPGTVLHSEFAGSQASYEIDIGLDQTVKAIAARRHGAALLTPGSQVRLILPDSARLLPGRNAGNHS